MSNKNNMSSSDLANKTLIILDWDDTLFPTTWTVKNNINLSDVEVINRYFNFFSELDSLLYKLLRKLLEYGQVIIVTNAMPQWVKTSSSVVPNTQLLLSKLKIVSARKNYENKSKSMMDWKKHAFKDETAPTLLNIISIGDAEYEYNALVNLYHPASKKILKSVKLIKNPNFETIVDQLEVLYSAVPDICTASNHLDLNFDFYTKNKSF